VLVGRVFAPNGANAFNRIANVCNFTLSNHQSAVMKRALLFSALSITLLSSCSTAFKSGQTPDDVYYSPGRELAAAKEDESREKDQAVYEEYISSQDDRYLRMKVANRNRWTSIDDYDYWHDSRYDFSNYNNYATYMPFNACYGRNAGYLRNPYSGYGNYNMPYHTIIAYSSPKYVGGYTSGSNISAYRNKNYSNTNYGYKDPKTGAFISTSNTSNFGNLLKRVFSSGSSSSGNSNPSSFDRPARTFSTPTTTPTNSSSTTTPSTSSSAGGHSGGYSSTGSSTSTGRGGKG
jgi:hypothetical protein